MSRVRSTSILFITGAFVSHHCWDEWKCFFEQKGFNTQAPAWLYKDAPADVLRERHPDAQLASLRLTTLIDHYETVARSFAEPPVIIGHSIGGLIAQILLQRGAASAAAAIHSVPPQGIFSFKFSFLRAGWGPLGFFTSVRKTFLMSFRQWQYAFTNGMPLEWQEKGYQLAIPESKLIVRDTITAAARVDWQQAHAPLLFIAGDNDHTIPASINYDNYRRYKNEDSVRDYKLFPGRNHYVLNQPGWQEVATYILEWLNKQGI
ncbi:MAG: alpha/beta hydrolase [Niastella sp.]|nr:alpha/beta hydrolase [Niastella sp.]